MSTHDHGNEDKHDPKNGHSHGHIHKHDHAHKHGHSHSHGHHHHHWQSSLNINDKKTMMRIRWAFYLNFGFACIEVLGGLKFSSIAILADAIHDFGDAFSLGLALFLQMLARKKPNSDFTYGYRRLSVVSAVCAGAILVMGSVFVFLQALPRLFTPYVPVPSGMLGLAIVGVAVNGIAAWILARGATQNEKILTWHLLEDLLGWAATIVGAILIWIFGWYWIDALLAILISIFIFWNASRNLYSTLLVFLQVTPSGLEKPVLEKELKTIQGVVGVHDFHIWTLDGENHVATLHVVHDKTVMETEKLKEDIRHRLCHWGNFHVTIELEADHVQCVDRCDPHEPG